MFCLNVAIVLSQGMPHLKIFDTIKRENDILYEHMGASDNEGIKKVLVAVSRLPVDVLIIDTDISSDTGLLFALHSFRIARPDARVIVFVNRRQPGDETVSGIVSLGIYDIIEDANEEQLLSNLILCLKASYPYSRAVKWHKGFRSESDIKIKEVRERVVIERRPVGKVTVAVAGVANGVGCTHTSITVASFLSAFGSVALIEDSQRPSLGYISGLGQEIPNKAGAFRHYNADIYPLPQQQELFADSFLYERLLPSLGNYEYIVRDLGVLDPERLRELYRAESGILVVSASPWRIMDFVKMHNLLKDDFANINIVSAFGSDKDLRLYRQVTSIVPIMLPLSVDPSHVSKDGEGVFKKMFDFLLPERKQKRKFGLF